MKFLFYLLAFCYPFVSFGQTVLPFYYEQNMPLYGNPSTAAQYYFEYHTQARVRLFDHTIKYDDQGRVKTHIKTNKSLLNVDSIPLSMRGLIDLGRPITITYNFTYDDKKRLSLFNRNQYQDSVGSYVQEEEWKYDNYGMLTEHNFWDVDNNTKVLKSLSTRRNLVRDASQRIQKIENLTFDFNKGLIVSGITEYKYVSDKVDTIVTYRIVEGKTYLADRKYGIDFERYVPTNPDSNLFNSYLFQDADGEVKKQVFTYDQSVREMASYTLSISNDTISKKEWVYEKYKTIEKTDDQYISEVFYDETGYVRYTRDFEFDNRIGKPADTNTRVIKNGRIESTLLAIWDDVTKFYRKDTEYKYGYEDLTPISVPAAALIKNIYPNPSKGILHLDNLDGIKSIDLISSDGKSIPLNISHLIQANVPQGIYCLRLLYDDFSTQSIKIVME